jgi:hypothetical protein
VTLFGTQNRSLFNVQFDQLFARFECRAGPLGLLKLIFFGFDGRTGRVEVEGAFWFLQAASGVQSGAERSGSV